MNKYADGNFSPILFKEEIKSNFWNNLQIELLQSDK